MAEQANAGAGTAIAALSFEAALEELEQVVRQLESGEVPLEASIALYARGAELRRHCEDKLRAAEARVEEITRGPNGAVGARPVDIP